MGLYSLGIATFQLNSVRHRPMNSPSTVPYSMTPEFSEQRFNDVYTKALQRKKLFKEYIARHQVLEKVASDWT